MKHISPILFTQLTTGVHTNQQQSSLIAIVSLMVISCAAESHTRSGTMNGPLPRSGQLLVMDELNSPQPQIKLLINGSLIQTDDDGYVRLPQLSTNYSVVLLGTNILYEFDNLKSCAPVIKVPYASYGHDTRSANIYVSRPASLAASERIALLQAVRGPHVGNQTSSFTFDQSSFTSTVEWTGEENPDVLVEAFVFDFDATAAKATQYTGYARLDSKIEAQTTLTWNPQFSQIPYGNAELRIDATVPNNLTVVDDAVTVHYKTGGGGVLPGIEVNPSSMDASGATSILIPDLNSSSFDIRVTATGDEGTCFGTAFNLPFDAMPSSVSIEIPDPITAQLPEDGALVDLRTSVFSWAGTDSNVSYLFASSDTSAIDYQIAGSTANAKIPDATALGIPLPTTGTWQWKGNFVGGAKSVDDYAAGAPVSGWCSTQTRHVVLSQ